MNNTPAQTWHSRARIAAQSGDNSNARLLLISGLAEHPNDGTLWHAAGNLLLQMGDADGAAKHFAKATELVPSNQDFVVDRAIALSAGNRNEEALIVLQPIEKKAKRSASYWSTRANAARGAGNLTDSAKWYDRALALEPNRPKALHGRACVALERAEPAALKWFDRTLNVNSGDPHPWLGKAQALDVNGDKEGARKIATSLAEQAPNWTEGLRFLAQLRLDAGEDDFTSHYGDAAKKVPQDPNIYSAWCSMLAGHGCDEKAIEVAAEAQRAFPDQEYFAFLEAVHASNSGLLDRAETIFSALKKDDDDRWLQEARHRIRTGEHDRAAGLLDQIAEQDPWNINAWALRDVVWRLMDDPRSQWLHEQEGLARLMPLHNGEKILPRIVSLLHELHDNSPFPLGQSLRGGTQTRGNLLDRAEAAFAELKAAILQTVDDYKEALPPIDDTHPLLRLRNEQWRMAGSWSVRLAGGGDFHTSHIHPQGIVSSALYCDIPDEVAGEAQHGWLELGRPAPDLGLDLEPVQIIKPIAGHLALFPSTLYHGTRPFPDGQRMSVAFDIALDRALHQGSAPETAPASAQGSTQ